MSDETPWTPGPWVNDEGCVNGRDSRERFAGSVSVDIFDASEWSAELHDEAQANARLIAAAPAMAELLEESLRPADERGFLEWSGDVKALLTKIKGTETK